MEKPSTPENTPKGQLCAQKYHPLELTPSIQIECMVVTAQGWARSMNIECSWAACVVSPRAAEMDSCKDRKESGNSLDTLRPACKCLHLIYCIFDTYLILRHCRIPNAKQKILFSLMAKGILPSNWKRETRSFLLKSEAKNLNFNRAKKIKKYWNSPWIELLGAINYCTVKTHMCQLVFSLTC